MLKKKNKKENKYMQEVKNGQKRTPKGTNFSTII